MNTLKMLIPTVLMLLVCSGCVKQNSTEQNVVKGTKTEQPKKQVKKQSRRSWWRKKKNKKPQPVVVVSPSKDAMLKERDQKISALCKRFVDVEHDATINWNMFCEKINAHLRNDPEFTEICQLLNDLKTSTSATSTCLKMRPYLKNLPKVVYDEFEKFSVSELLHLIRTRMKQEIVAETPAKPAGDLVSKPAANQAKA